MIVHSNSTEPAPTDAPMAATRTLVPAFDRYDVVVIAGCFVFLYANLFARPETPFLLGGDQVFFWMDSQRLLYGEHVYRDFFQFTPPGADLIYLGVFRLFGPRIWTPNLVVLLLGTSLCALCLRISRSMMSRALAVLATLLYLVLVIGTTLDGTHHWLSLLAATGAVAVLMKGRTTARIAIAGALLGVATFITQSTGPVAAVGISMWLTWERFRTQEPWSSYLKRQNLLFAPLVLTWIVLSSYYIATIGLDRLWFFYVTYVWECVVSGWNTLSIGFPGTLSRATLLPLLHWCFAYILLPAVYAICLWRCWRISCEGPSDKVARVSLLTLFGAALFLEVALSPSWFRFFCSALPGVILLIWLVGEFGRITLHATRLLWVGVIVLAAQQTWSVRAHNSTIEELPAGRIAASPLDAEKLAWLAAHTRPGQFMLQAGWPSMYVPLGLRNPIYLDVIPGCGSATRLAYVALSVRQLEAKRVRYIVWSPRMESLDDSPAVFREYLRGRYRQIWRFSDQDEIWERRPEGDPSTSQRHASQAREPG